MRKINRITHTEQKKYQTNVNSWPTANQFPRSLVPTSPSQPVQLSIFSGRRIPWKPPPPLLERRSTERQQQQLACVSCRPVVYLRVTKRSARSRSPIIKTRRGTRGEVSSANRRANQSRSRERERERLIGEIFPFNEENARKSCIQEGYNEPAGGYRVNEKKRFQ